MISFHDHKALSVEYFKKNGRLSYQDGINFDEEAESEELLKAFELPPERAIAQLESRGYNISWDWRAMDALAHKKAFTVAKVMNMDVLQLLKGELQKSLEEGKPFSQFKKDVMPRLEQAGWLGKKEVVNPETGEKETVEISTPSRLKKIFATNLQNDMMQGRFRQMLDTADKRPYMQIIATQDSHTTDVCNGLHLKVVRIDDPNARIPGFHYECRTRMRSLSEKQVKRLGLDVLDGDIFTKDGTKPHEGFDGPPLREWKPNLSKYDPDIAAEFKQAEAKRLQEENRKKLVDIKNKLSLKPESPVIEKEFLKPVEADVDRLQTALDFMNPFIKDAIGTELKAQELYNAFSPQHEKLRVFNLNVKPAGDKVVVSGIFTDENGAYYGMVQRTIHKAKGKMYVKHDMLTVDEKYQGQGISQNIWKTSLQYYDLIGVTEIKVHAAMDAGHVVWGKFGFDFDNDEASTYLGVDDQAADWQENFLKYIKDETGVETDEIIDEVEKLDQPRDFLGFKKVINGKDIDGTVWKRDVFNDSKGGYDWVGKLDISKGSAGRKRVENYLNKKRKPE